MDKAFFEWLEGERDEAFEMAQAKWLAGDRQDFWEGHYNMLSAAIEEIKAVMYKEATGR